MSAGAGDRCHQCGHERWASDRYCANCGVVLPPVSGGAGFDIGDSAPQVFEDQGQGPWRRIVVLALVLIGLVGATALWFQRSDSVPEVAEASEGTLPEDPSPEPEAEPGPTESADQASEQGSGQASETPEPPERAPSEFAVDVPVVVGHGIANARLVLADGNDTKIVDLRNGSVESLFDNVNFFEIVAIGEAGITAATGFHQAEMVGPGALQHFPYEGEATVIGSLADFLGGDDVLFTRNATSSPSGEQIIMHDVVADERVEFEIPAGATYVIRGDSLFLEAGERILRMGSGLTDWELVTTGRIEPLPGDGVMVLDCVDQTGTEQDPCAIELYRSDGTLAVRHERSSPLVQSGALFNRADTRALSSRGDRVAQLINGGGGGIWDLEAGLISALIPRGVTRVVWTPDDGALIGTRGDESQLVHVHGLTGAGTDLGVDAGPYLLLGVTAIAVDQL